MKKLTLLMLLYVPFSFISKQLNAQTPIITSFTPSSGPPGTLVTIIGTNLLSPTGFTIGGATALEISNTGTKLVGMVMPASVTGTVSLTTVNGTAISSGNFTVTATPYPAVQQGSKVVGTGAGVWSNPFQGGSVSLSADGNTGVVGATGDGDNGYVGAVWVYSRSVGVWSQEGSKLVGTGAVGAAGQGSAVSLSADGNTAIVGAIANVGAWIYTRSAGIWTQQGSKLPGTIAVGDWAPQGCSISADGNTAIVGGQDDSIGVGAAWVYVRSAGLWTQQGNKLVGTGAAGNAHQGCSVSLSSDGNTAIIGGRYDNSYTGAVWIYIRSAGVWTQQGSKLVGTGAVGAAQQGTAVSLSADGNTAIVGGSYDDGSTGAAWIFTRNAGVWKQQGNKLIGTGAVGNAWQGCSVSLSADGNTAIVGGDYDNGYMGAVWVFTRSGGVWTQRGSKLVGTGALGPWVYQGRSVSLSSDGSTALIGGSGDNSYTGAAWVFVSSATVGIENANTSSKQLSVYPNPNSGVFAVSPSDFECRTICEGDYSIVNSIGEIVQSFKLNAINNYSIEIENLSNGLYYIVGFNENQMSGQKVLVAK